MNAISLKAHSSKNMSSKSLSAQSIKPANFIIKLASLMLACLLSFILSFSAHAAIDVYDLTGKIILSKSAIQTSNVETSIDLSNAAIGIYFVKITANNQSTVKRIIKE